MTDSHDLQVSDDELDDFDDSSEQDALDRRKRRRRWLIALIAILVVLGLIAAVIGTYLYGLHRDLYSKSVQVELQKSDQEQGKGTNILLLGSDSRGEDAQKEKVYGQRSDVIMLVHLSADHKSAYVSSFPRDLYVDIPGKGKGRINSAIAYGGVPLTVTTVEDFVGVKIDHVMLIDFEGIQGLVDALGGVEVHVDQNFEADGVKFTQGLQTMNGKDALVFVRARKMLKDGDFGRNRHQRALLSAIATKIISRDTLTDPGKIQKLVSTVSPYLTLDKGLSSSAIVSLAYDSRSLRGSDIKYLSVPYGAPTTTKGGASVVSVDEKGMEEFRAAVKNDDMAAYYARPTTKR